MYSSMGANVALSLFLIALIGVEGTPLRAYNENELYVPGVVVPYQPYRFVNHQPPEVLPPPNLEAVQESVLKYQQIQNSQNQVDHNEPPPQTHSKKPAYKKHLFDEPELETEANYQIKEETDPIEDILESMQHNKFAFEDEEDGEDFGAYKASPSNHFDDHITISEDSYNHDHHEESDKKGEVHYHQHKHLHDHDHKQQHKHQHNQEHKHEHGHKHEAQHKHDHGHDHHHGHKHGHEHGHKHQHHGEHHHGHKHGHKHGHEHGHEHGHKHQHNQHHKHDHKHGHDHKSEHKHQHHQKHSHDHHSAHKHDHGHKHNHGHKHGHQHGHHGKHH